MHFAGLLVHHKRTLQQVETVVVDTIGEAFFQQIEIEVLTFAQGHSCVTRGRMIARSIMGAIGAAGNAIARASRYRGTLSFGTVKNESRRIFIAWQRASS
jgi:hypothetical protein